MSSAVTAHAWFNIPAGVPMIPVRRVPFVIALAVPTLLFGQDRLPGMPGYSQFTRVAPLIGQVNQEINRQRVTNITWLPNGAGVEYTVGGQGGKRFRYTFATKTKTEVPFPQPQSRPAASAPQRACSQVVDRGRQVEAELSP